ncbi:MAG: DUF3788 domain-containing protein [Lachnospiraceae bacterium]|nr:DUF3788 domain-containing protein [Lachnospiraceae bacterium]
MAIDLQDKEYCPALEEMGEYIRNDVFGKFCCAVKDTYKAKETIEFSSCSWERGWNIKFKKSGKTLCTIYPKEACFTVLVVVGKGEKELVEAELSHFSQTVQELYRQTKEGNGQKWLMIPVEDVDSVYEDVLRLIEIRRGIYHPFPS